MKKIARLKHEWMRGIGLLFLGILSSLGLEAQTFVEKENNTVLDTRTKLVWWKCAGATETGECNPAKSSYKDAEIQCEESTLGGRIWRLPSRDELAFLLDYESREGWMHSSFTIQNGWYWSDRVNKRFHRNFLVNLTTGEFELVSHNFEAFSLCVSPPEVFTDRGDGTVLDSSTNLLWRKCSHGQNDDAECSGMGTQLNYADAQNYCSSLSEDGGWRVPTRVELLSLYDKNKNGYIGGRSLVFPNSWLHYLSSSPSRYDWLFIVDSYRLSDSKEGNVRCVRENQN